MHITSCYWKIGEKEGACPQNKNNQEARPLSPMLQRRLTPFGRMALEGLHKSLRALPQDIKWVVSCRHGDTHRMVRLLSKIAQGETVSPTDFSLSVHNAIIGLFSIETNNKKTHTALSGGEETFEMGLLEAFTTHQESKETVGYFYYEQPLPEMYQDKVQDDTRDVCILMILEAEDNQDQKNEENFLKLTYVKNRQDKVFKGFQRIIALIEFLNNDNQNFKISIPGGAFYLERPGTKM